MVSRCFLCLVTHLGEPHANLVLGALAAVASVHQVPPDADAVVAAEGACRIKNETKSPCVSTQVCERGGGGAWGETCRSSWCPTPMVAWFTPFHYPGPPLCSSGTWWVDSWFLMNAGSQGLEEFLSGQSQGCSRGERTRQQEKVSSPEVYPHALKNATDLARKSWGWWRPASCGPSG